MEHMAVVVKANGIPFWLVGAFTTHFSTYFSLDLDVHWGYGILTPGHMALVVKNGVTPKWLAQVNGNMDDFTCGFSGGLIWTHTHMGPAQGPGDSESSNRAGHQKGLLSTRHRRPGA